MATSYNGWTASPDPRAIGVVPMRVGAAVFPAGVRGGDSATILAYVARRFHSEVEALYTPGCWGYAYRQNRNASNLSVHAAGMAIDCNAPSHPNGVRGTFTNTQLGAIRRIVADCGGVVRWGGDFTGTPDEMHFEIIGTPEQVARAADRLRGSGATIDLGDDDMADPGVVAALNNINWLVNQMKPTLDTLVATVNSRPEYVFFKVAGDPGSVYEANVGERTYSGIPSMQVYEDRVAVLTALGIPFKDFTSADPVTGPDGYGTLVPWGETVGRK